MSFQHIKSTLDRQLNSYGLKNAADNSIFIDQIKKWIIKNCKDFQASNIVSILISRQTLFIKTNHSSFAYIIRLNEKRLKQKFERELKDKNIRKISYSW